MSELKSSADVLNRFMGEATAGSEWVQIEDWSTVTKGARVRAVLGESTILATVESSWSDVGLQKLAIKADGSATSQWTIMRRDWSLFIEKPKVQLPTSQGSMIAINGVHDGKTAHGPGSKYVRAGGSTFWFNYRGHVDAAVVEALASEHGFTMVARPVAEVAAEVLARLASWWEFGPPQNFVDEFDAIAAEFGVTT